MSSFISPVVPLQMEVKMSDAGWLRLTSASIGIAEEPFPENDLMNLNSYPSLYFLSVASAGIVQGPADIN
jgi:hypothetical protein